MYRVVELFLTAEDREIYMSVIPELAKFLYIYTMEIYVTITVNEVGLCRK